MSKLRRSAIAGVKEIEAEDAKNGCRREIVCESFDGWQAEGIKVVIVDDVSTNSVVSELEKDVGEINHGVRGSGRDSKVDSMGRIETALESSR